ncbi:MAG: class I SAM-dependent methyltransferase [Candidatus Rokubacteria bacterium]|nr:class I SAM-dependent methyltransferase [Candidatus Rokubacteria bacterium]
MATPAEIFDAMAPEYDVLEPWYEHLYARLHAILAHALAPSAGPRGRALDAGCGHGFQTVLLQRLGYVTHGVDLAAALLALARQRVPAAALARGDLTALPYADGSFDVVSCCGSTLSFVDDPDRALAEIARVLRPGGRVVLEYEHKWSFDLAWTAASALTRDALGYGISAGTLWRALRRPSRAPLVLSYPGYGTLTLFSRRDLVRRLAAAGLRTQRAWGIHAFTNLIPSTTLHQPRLSRGLAAVYRALRAIETVWTPAALANSVVVLAVKPHTASTATGAPPREAER